MHDSIGRQTDGQRGSEQHRFLGWPRHTASDVAANRILATRGLEKLGGITAMDATGLVEMLKPPKFFWDIFLNPSI
jgi:hypothetical protein